MELSLKKVIEDGADIAFLYCDDLYNVTFKKGQNIFFFKDNDISSKCLTFAFFLFILDSINLQYILGKNPLLPASSNNRKRA